MLIKSPDLKTLKIKVDFYFQYKIEFSPESLKKILVLEMDFRGNDINSAVKINEQIPFPNNLVSLKLIGTNAIINSNFKKKLPFLTQLIYGNQSKPQKSKLTQSLYRFVMKVWNLKRNLRKIFRKEIIEEIVNLIE